ncbi:L-rhamnose mutarotase [Streptomyces sp. NK08204]|uniref:L-rhamnose mutarotase n=1 Tax=Streptomyces sp. NK08204 TaxID=2873260 RepID=UPI0035A93685
MRQYEAAHHEVPKELTDALRAAGVRHWTIWRLHRRLRCPGPGGRGARTGRAHQRGVPDPDLQRRAFLSRRPERVGDRGTARGGGRVPGTLPDQRTDR